MNDPAAEVQAQPDQEQLGSIHAQEYRQNLTRDLEADERWYARWANLYSGVWNSATLAIIVLTALTSLFVAGDYAPKWVLVALPAIASVLTTLLVQFRVRETWQLRELGRLDIADLIARAKSAHGADDAKLLDELRAIELQQLAIARAQASQFFAYLSQKPEKDTGKK